MSDRLPGPGSAFIIPYRAGNDRLLQTPAVARAECGSERAEIDGDAIGAVAQLGVDERVDSVADAVD